LPRWTRTAGGTPPLDVDERLISDGARRLAADARRRSRGDSHAANPHAAGLELAALHDAGDLDHRSLVPLDLRHQLLRTVHANVRALGNIGAAGLFFGAARSGEDLALRASRNGDAYRVFRDRLCLLREGRHRQQGGGDGGQRGGRARASSAAVFTSPSRSRLSAVATIESSTERGVQFSMCLAFSLVAFFFFPSSGRICRTDGSASAARTTPQLC